MRQKICTIAETSYDDVGTGVELHKWEAYYRAMGMDVCSLQGTAGDRGSAALASVLRPKFVRYIVRGSRGSLRRSWSIRMVSGFRSRS